MWGWVGIGIVTLFIVTWLAAMLIYRLKHFEDLGFGPPPGKVVERPPEGVPSDGGARERGRPSPADLTPLPTAGKPS